MRPQIFLGQGWLPSLSSGTYIIFGTTNFAFLRRIHRRYGEFVRTGPNEVSIFHPAAIQVLDSSSSHTTKDNWYDFLKPLNSAVFTRNESEHKEWRKSWTQSLSKKSMGVYQPRIVELALSLSDTIADYANTPVDVNEVMSWFSFDVMAEIVFGNHFGLVKSKSMHPAIRHRDRALAMLGPLEGAIWIARLGLDLVPFYGRIKDWLRKVAFCEDQMRKRMSENNPKLNMASWFIEEFHRNQDLQDIGARNLLLTGTAVSAMVAGSDTVRSSLIAIWWYLSKYPEHASKLQAEIQHVEVGDMNTLSSLPHLNVESAFVSPDEFIPERWYSRPELIRDKRAFGPFGFGNHHCVGQPVAYTELRLVTATLLQRYSVCFAPGYKPESMWLNMKDQVTAQPGEVLCIFEPRH
ncbi:hypothetical protein DL769_009436 [Monosporascus sp. CRB-8-3]|nr:hypothetical protein DL769_009436 [Monosporascus sp. CRB-8-3]